jgi:hypothetical protein
MREWTPPGRSVYYRLARPGFTSLLDAAEGLIAGTDQPIRLNR